MFPQEIEIVLFQFEWKGFGLSGYIAYMEF